MTTYSEKLFKGKQHILTRIKLKPGKTERTKEFLESLHKNHQTEMKQILEESNMPLDCSFIDHTDHGDYVYIFKRLLDIEDLKGNIAKSKIPLYDQIRAWGEECFEGERVDLKAHAVFDLTP